MELKSIEVQSGEVTSNGGPLGIFHQRTNIWDELLVKQIWNECLLVLTAQNLLKVGTIM